MEDKHQGLIRLSVTLIVLLQLPGLAVLLWGLGKLLFEGDGSFMGLMLLIGFFSPPFLWLGWLLAVPTAIVSRRARSSWVLWAALAMGVAAQFLYGAVIGYRWS